MQLSATHGVAEPLSLDGHPQTSGPHSGFRHRHSGQLLTRTFRFQKKRVIICFSRYKTGTVRFVDAVHSFDRKDFAVKL